MYCVMTCIFFFFSSRRRHTRWTGDWSSDVCSSDLTDRSRRPYRYENQLPFQVENYILNVKREHPSWGARKIRERLMRRFRSEERRVGKECRTRGTSGE